MLITGGQCIAITGAVIGMLFASGPGAASVSTFAMLMLNAVLASVIAPVAATSLSRLAATSLALLLLGITLFHVHRVGAGREAPTPSLQPPEVP